MGEKYILLPLEEYLSLLEAANHAKEARVFKRNGKKWRKQNRGFHSKTNGNSSSTESKQEEPFSPPSPKPIKLNLEKYEPTCIGLIFENNERQQKIPARRVERNYGQHEPAFLNRKQTDCDCTMRADMVAVMESKK